jgi:uncharacterized protein (TIGR02996 family)
MSTLHSDPNGLLKAILENPYDNFPRRAYADWLEEHGETERATFIRAQLSQDDLTTAGHLRATQQKVEWRIGSENHAVWLGPLREVGTFEYQRGFASAVKTTHSRFLAHAKLIFGREPVILVELTDKRPLHKRGRCKWLPFNTAPHSRHGAARLGHHLWQALDPPKMATLRRRKLWARYRGPAFSGAVPKRACLHCKQHSPGADHDPTMRATTCSLEA